MGEPAHDADRRLPGVDLGPVELQRPPAGRADDLGFGLRPLTGVIGAAVDGLDLTEDLAPDVVAGLRRALLDWKVLVFPDQAHPDESARALRAPVELGRHWGAMETHPGPSPDWPEEIVRLDRAGGYENGWHNDSTWHPNPPQAVVLRSVVVPPAGGDTLFADAAAAFDALPRDLQALVVLLHGAHEFTTSFGRAMDDDEREAAASRFGGAVHPVVRAHPEIHRPGMLPGCRSCPRSRPSAASSSRSSSGVGSSRAGATRPPSSRPRPRRPGRPSRPSAAAASTC